MTFNIFFQTKKTTLSNFTFDQLDRFRYPILQAYYLAFDINSTSFRFQTVSTLVEKVKKRNLEESKNSVGIQAEIQMLYGPKYCSEQF